jgi:alkanesulfonate monooxygenase SsuD/methylene tetrahydromethanopterin reductase-like flavin-dependent oxidoreductase (luciferase family)
MVTHQTRRYGVLLPHFGEQASRERLVGVSRQLEAYGFDSVWVRDHLVYHPHGFEHANRNHVDPFVTLSAIAGATDRLILGTASMIPHRHPIHAALVIGSLDFIAGPGRVIIGFGLGTFQHEFDAAGIGQFDRRELVQEQIEIFRKLWTGEVVSHQGKHYSFSEVDIHPTPSQHLPIWYCGTSLAAARRAVEFCDGWMPGLMPLRDYRIRRERMQRLAEQSGKPMPPTGMEPFVLPGRTAEEALRYLDPGDLFQFASSHYPPPPSGAFRTVDDLDGAVIYGPPDRIVEGVRRWQEAGCSHFIFDLRHRFADYEECVQLIAEDVLPELRRGDPSASDSP